MEMILSFNSFYMQFISATLHIIDIFFSLWSLVILENELYSLNTPQERLKLSHGFFKSYYPLELEREQNYEPSNLFSSSFFSISSLFRSIFS